MAFNPGRHLSLGPAMAKMWVHSLLACMEVGGQVQVSPRAQQKGPEKGFILY